MMYCKAPFLEALTICNALGNNGEVLRINKEVEIDSLDSAKPRILIFEEGAGTDKLHRAVRRISWDCLRTVLMSFNQDVDDSILMYIADNMDRKIGISCDSCVRLTPVVYDYISQKSRLRELSARWNPSITAESYLAITKMLDLQALAIDDYAIIDDRTLANIDNLQKLEYLEMSGDIGPNTANALSGIEELRSINFGDSAALTDQMCATMLSSPNLCDIRLSNCTALTAQMFRQLANSWRINSISLSSIDPDVVSGIGSEYVSLKHIRLHNIPGLTCDHVGSLLCRVPSIECVVYNRNGS